LKPGKGLQQHWPIALGLLACFLPWANGAGAALALNAWDLAEWSSLHPLSRSAAPTLGASFGLRALPLFLLALALWRAGLPTPLRAGLTLVVAIALLPPPEFFRSDLADANYRQQLVIAAGALFIGLGSGWRMTWSTWLHALLAAMALAVAWLSLSAALDLQRNLGLEAGAGIGPLLFTLAMLIRGGQALLTRKGRPAPDRPF